ncbi:hypothetical protein [Brevundimonas sp. TWP2-3-4b2]|uniref:hypothetical protein n=1 Tax=Brevundimonas sp. TWP2-3-4b2 TaxID=2804595 RepID=UPI003CEEE745
MNDDIIRNAIADLHSMEVEREGYAVKMKDVDQRIAKQKDFIEQAQKYAGVKYPIRDDIPMPPKAVKMYEPKVPSPDSKRFLIGNAVLEVLTRVGRSMHTKELMDYIDQTILEPSTQKQNYLSNALSKDARFLSTPRGWAKNMAVLPVEEAN